MPCQGSRGVCRRRNLRFALAPIARRPRRDPGRQPRPRDDRICTVQRRGDSLMIPRPAVPPPPPPPVTLPKLLLVEGDTPMHFFEALLQHLLLADQIEIRNFRGIGDFRAFVADLAGTAEFQRLVT